jgi:hypothetical protein
MLMNLLFLLSFLFPFNLSRLEETLSLSKLPSPETTTLNLELSGMRLNLSWFKVDLLRLGLFPTPLSSVSKLS